jgi:tetratricopeptide (TPR) repeat protein
MKRFVRALDPRRPLELFLLFLAAPLVRLRIQDPETASSGTGPSVVRGRSMTRFQRIGAAALALALFGVAVPPAVAQESAAVRDPDIEANKVRGDELVAEGKFADAVDAYDQAITADPTYIEALVAKGYALNAMLDFTEAIKAFSQALNLTNNLPAAFNGRGEALMEMSPPDYNLALNDFTYALSQDRRNPRILSNFGHVVVLLGQDPASALSRLNEALALNPEDARAYRDRGMANAQLGDFDNAVLDLQKASEVNPGDFENYATLAQIYGIQENYSGAVDAISGAIANYNPEKSTDPKVFVSGYVSRAELRLKLAEMETDPELRTANLEGVIADTESVLEAIDDRTIQAGQAMYQRGRAERMLERFSNAVDTLTRAIQIGMQSPDQYLSTALLYRGICWYYIGSLELARGDFEQAASVGSGFSDPRIPLWIGITYHREGDFRQAIESYSEAIAKSPGFSLAHINKGRAYMDLGEYRKAIQSFGNAIRSEPNVGDHYYNVGLAYLQLDEFQKAVDFLNLALRQENPKPKYYSQMAVALRGIGRNDLAPEYERKATEVQSATP